MNNIDEFKQLKNYNKLLLPLQVFTEIVEKTTNSKIDVTISVHRHIITGQLVSPIEYYKELKRMTLAGLKEKDDADLYHQLHIIFEKMINVQNMKEELSLNYVCIRNPVFILGNTVENSFPVDGLPYWIGKMESVDGFALGELDAVIDNTNQSLK